jgi:L-threonylcarbamoyladenylate synthase
MRLYTLADRDEVLAGLARGETLVYPTDTVYGIGCDATNYAAVARVREIKHRDEKPFSVIAPSMQWIRTNCVIPAYAEELLAKLPGPYTFVFLLRDACVALNVSGGALGVRIPDHAVATLATAFGKPVVTTSANISGEPVIRSVSSLPEGLASVDMVIDGGVLGGTSSSVTDCTGDEARVLR